MLRRWLVLGAFLLALMGFGTAVPRAGAAAPPIANADGPYVGVAGVPIQFTGVGSSGANLSFFWNFGDGTTGTGVTVRHTYAMPGVYTVTLTVQDGVGQTSIATTTATVGAGSPIISGNPGQVCVPVAFGVTCRPVHGFQPRFFTPTCRRFVFKPHVGHFRPFCVVVVPQPVVVVKVPVKVVLVPVHVVCPVHCLIFADP
jgi:hypothetical protein